MPVAMQGRGLKGKVIYVNAGHGGWTANDRPLATINYAAMDTLGFFETKANLWKAIELKRRLERYGARVVMSRTENGYVTAGQKNATQYDRVEHYGNDSVRQQLVDLERIAMQVDSLNPDYFISIHSNAAKDGSTVNYLLLLYRGETGNDYAKGSIERSKSAFDIIWDNPLSVWTHSSPDNQYVAGDLTWMGGTPPGKPNSIGYTGYLSVLKHRVPSFLAEGSFHTYHPERHRLLNRDYCRMEGIRYFRAINAFFKGKKEKVGHIAGTLKDAVEKMHHELYKYDETRETVDGWVPLNYGTVYLVNSKGYAIRAYCIDDNFNGVFVFTDVKPGKYVLRYEARGYSTTEEPIEVKAGDIVYRNARLMPAEL